MLGQPSSSLSMLCLTFQEVANGLRIQVCCQSIMTKNLESAVAQAKLVGRMHGVLCRDQLQCLLELKHGLWIPARLVTS